VDYVHGLVDQWRSWPTNDHGQGIGQRSPECGLASAVGLGSLPQLHGEGEEDEGVLTLGGVGRQGD
jgi:hypothetical protein